ncbi:MAG: hypothetical protein GXC78_12425 [Chitinophagaceae bacterium]|nr:hypothetical protein [Chitinophagaceae bacterium]
MKIGVVLLCRFSSSRLPGKIFKQIEGRPLIDYIVERILNVVSLGNLVIATSTDPSDDQIAAYCLQHGFEVYRGSLANVAERFMNAAQKKEWDYAVRINGDNLFVEMDTMRQMINLARTGEYDFLSNTHEKTFPQGMSVEVVKMDFYKKVYDLFSCAEDFEHVTYYLHRNPVGRFYFLKNTTVPGAGSLKFAIDEQKDFDLGQQIFSRFKGPHINYGMKAIIEIYNQLKNE